VDGRQFTHAELETRSGADAGHAAIPQSDECRRRRNRGIGPRRQKQDRAKL